MEVKYKSTREDALFSGIAVKKSELDSTKVKFLENNQLQLVRQNIPLTGRMPNCMAKNTENYPPGTVRSLTRQKIEFLEAI